MFWLYLARAGLLAVWRIQNSGPGPGWLAQKGNFGASSVVAPFRALYNSYPPIENK